MTVITKVAKQTAVLPDYESPPVTEVVIGHTFQPLLSLKVPHIGLLWNEFRDEFPRVEHALPLGIEKALIEGQVGNWPTPRIWFINASEDKLIQIQHDRFYCNWRKRTDSDAYPRYPVMIEMYDKVYSHISGFLRRENIGEMIPIEYELKYVNRIPQGAGWETEDDVQKLFPDFTWRADPERFLSAPKGGNWSAMFPLPERMGRLVVRVQAGVRTLEDGALPIVALELTVNGPLPGAKPVSSTDWFALARSWIVRGFADLTSKEVQNTVWRRKNGNR